ncbi:MAG: hypothetical protein UV78_C0036G0008 [Parcubacteria group bacterium GW2011_GWA2_43_17]|nr:MAG: hypothetical protein UV78_C0036G0008 [Parcubacteria group bacterium GW2011_GWA2_43_17]KKT91384.1 MAG: hypothetical protein UW91_C0033G0014 [Parcubacteria group bacterium GW2011_GWF2_45_11]OGY96157.1 MAG: hypothetical protein A3J95_01105 [Candidatus Komeilibacteria bacterium RIFOXYC2_FULL_45_12]HAH04226.1 hypothetical protein [Candidatus Komeilibacteria bacterium]HBR13323.1 hypothetical protein [Candidatus Komeilibacteria bacterium]
MSQKPGKLSPRPTKIIKTGYKNLIVAFSFLAFMLVAAILYFALSQATVLITPSYAEQNVGFVVQVAGEVSRQDGLLDNQRIAGDILETTVEASQEFPAEKISLTADKARGRLTVYNDYSQPQPLIARTRFASPAGLIFRLLDGVTIPAKGKIEVEVEADQPGAAYEISDTDFSLPALSAWRNQYVYAKGGGSMVRQTSAKHQITQAVIDQATNHLYSQLLTQAKDELAKNLSADQTIIDDSLNTTVIKSSSSEQAGSGQANFTVSLALAVKALAINFDNLKKQAVASLPDSYSQNGALTKINYDSFTYNITFLDDNTENLLAQIKGEFSLSVATVNLDKSQLKGLSKKEAETYLDNLSGVETAAIRLPFWTKFLPTLEDHINIEIVK